MKIEPLYDKVVIKPLDEEEVTASGIVLPETVDKEKPMQGTVVAVGEGRRTRRGQITPLKVKVGDKVEVVMVGGPQLEKKSVTIRREKIP